MRRKIVRLIAILVAALAMSISTGAQATMLSVLASHSILTDVARNVAGDRAEVRSLIPVGADPHAFIPSPSDLTDVAGADLVFLVGAGYEESLLDAIESAGEMANIVVASACIQVRPFGAAMHHEDDHADEHEDEHTDEHDDDHTDAHDDDHDDDHADEHDDDHADEHDDDHADEHDDDHADEHDDEHADERDDDHAGDHDDDDHADEHDDDHADDMNGASDCDAHDAEFAAIVGEEEGEHAHFMTLGRVEDIDCGGGHGHDDEDDHAHGEGACDPHLWMDPHNVIYWVLKIRDTLSTQDPDNAATYAANAEAYSQELVALESDFILPALEDLPAEKRVLVTSHESMGYLATTFGFELITTVVPGMSTMVEPSARDVASLIDMVRDEGVRAIFGDAFAPQAIMSTIAAETGAELVSLYSDTLSDTGGPAATYLDYMRYNVATIVEALKGDG